MTDFELSWLPLFGGIALIMTILVILDTLGRRKERRAHKA